MDAVRCKCSGTWVEGPCLPCQWASIRLQVGYTAAKGPHLPGAGGLCSPAHHYNWKGAALSCTELPCNRPAAVSCDEMAPGQGDGRQGPPQRLFPTSPPVKTQGQSPKQGRYHSDSAASLVSILHRSFYLSSRSTSTSMVAVKRSSTQTPNLVAANATHRGLHLWLHSTPPPSRNSGTPFNPCEQTLQLGFLEPSAELIKLNLVPRDETLL